MANKVRRDALKHTTRSTSSGGRSTSRDKDKNTASEYQLKYYHSNKERLTEQNTESYDLQKNDPEAIAPQVGETAATKGRRRARRRQESETQEHHARHCGFLDILETNPGLHEFILRRLLDGSVQSIMLVGHTQARL